MVYHGHIRNGVVVLDGDMNIPEGTPVKIETLPAGSTASIDGRVEHLLQHARRTGVPDLAANVDHYLYGQPKVTDGGE